jgi:tRNA threonylcarbamoyladenosine biosynthesis protein TsaB
MHAPTLVVESPGASPALFLVLEASTSVGSVALIADGSPVAVRPVAMGAGREDQLFPAVQALLFEAGVTAQQLAGVVCGAGPGSFTSLRIAASLAKGLAHGAGVPLFAVSSLLLAAADEGVASVHGPAVVHADALRGERYVLDVIFDAGGRVQSHSALQRMTMEQLDAHAAGHPRFAVLGSPCPERELRIVTPTSTSLPRVAASAWMSAVPLDRWEPEYGRMAEAQVKWEAAHGAPLPSHRDA